MTFWPPLPVRPLTPGEVLRILAGLKAAMSGPASVVDWAWDTPLDVAWSGPKKPWSFLVDIGFPEGMSDILDGLGKKFGISFEEKELPLTRRSVATTTLRELCEFIAARATIPIFDPPTPEGAFLVVREILRQDGADVETLHPESPLEPYLRTHWKLFFERMDVLGVGAVPLPVGVSTSKLVERFTLAGLALFLGFVLAAIFIAGRGALSPPLDRIRGAWDGRLLPWLIGGACAAFASVAILQLLSVRLGFVRYRVGDLQTIGDLAAAIVRGHEQGADVR